MEFPEGLKYSREHTWLLVNGETAKVGITEFAQGELGEIVYVDLPRVGQTFNQNDVFGSVEAIKTTSDLFMPVTGEVVEINPRLKDEPKLVNSSPFGDGWMMVIKITNASEIKDLRTSQEYRTITAHT